MPEVDTLFKAVRDTVCELRNTEGKLVVGDYACSLKVSKLFGLDVLS